MRPWSDPFRKRTVRWMLPLLTRMDPIAASRRLASLGAWECKLRPGRRELFSRALTDLRDRLGCQWDIQGLAPGVIGNLWRWDARDFLLENLNEEALGRTLEVVGKEHLAEAMSHRRGVLLLFNHFGPFLIPAHWIVRQGLTLRWFTERPRSISKKVNVTFQTDGPLGQKGLFLNRQMNSAQGGSALRRAIRMLEAGMIVQAAGDVRWEGPRCVDADYLGHKFTFATNWVSLAALSRAPVLPVSAVLLPDGRYRIEFEPLELVARGAASDHEEAGYWIARNLARIETSIRAFPDNCGEYAFWSPKFAGLSDSLNVETESDSESSSGLPLPAPKD